MSSPLVVFVLVASTTAIDACPPPRDATASDSVCEQRVDTTTAKGSKRTPQLESNDDDSDATLGSDKSLDLDTGAICVLRGPDGACLDEDGE
jgi:hypothetical protein